MAFSAFIFTFIVCEPGKYLPKLDEDSKQEQQRLVIQTELLYNSNAEKTTLMNPIIQQPTMFFSEQRLECEKSSNVVRPLRSRGVSVGSRLPKRNS